MVLRWEMLDRLLQAADLCPKEAEAEADLCVFAALQKVKAERRVCKYSDEVMCMPAWCKLNLQEPPLFLPPSLPHLLRLNGNHGNRALLWQL